MVIYGENKAAVRKLGTTEPKKEPQEAKKSPAKKK